MNRILHPLATLSLSWRASDRQMLRVLVIFRMCTSSFTLLSCFVQVRKEALSQQARRARLQVERRRAGREKHGCVLAPQDKACCTWAPFAIFVGRLCKGVEQATLQSAHAINEHLFRSYHGAGELIATT